MGDYPASGPGSSGSSSTGSYPAYPAAPSESPSDHIRDLASAFSNAATVLSKHYTDLNNATSGLLDGTYPWQGQGASAFGQTWQIFGQYMQQLQQACSDSSNALTKFASKLDDIEREQAWNILLMIVGGIATIISFAAAIAEFGLDPFVDTLTGFLGTFTEQEGSDVVNVAEDITQADTEAATELQGVEDELTNVPLFTGNDPSVTADMPEALSPLNVDEMMLGIDDEINPDEFNPDEFFAKGQGKNFQYQNMQYLNSQPGMNQMPPGLNNPTAQYWIQQIENKGVQVSWGDEAQMRLLNSNAYGGVFNDINGQIPNPGAQWMVVGLSPDADATTVYEEYLHVTEAESRGWLPYSQGASPQQAQIENYEEEIRVEYQVMQNAQNLGTTQQEWNLLSSNRQEYIRRLLQALGNQPVPADLQQYFQDPPMPPNLPK